MKQILFLAIAFYFRKHNPKLGIKILTEKWAQSQLPEDFKTWWDENKKIFTTEVKEYVEKGIHFTYLGCVDYPKSFTSTLEDRPLFLTYLGNPHWEKHYNIAVVGSRKINSQTQEWLNEDFLSYLKVNEVCVVSGGARGVDQLAHLCALRAKRPTIVFLPSGLLNMYPKDLSSWTESIIAQGGAFVSEYWPTELMKKHYFIERNRLIAAMSQFVLITQGELRSGTMLTAQWALNLGKEIGVLPGHPKDSLFSGNLSLARSGVPIIIDVEDLMYHCKPDRLC